MTNLRGLFLVLSFLHGGARRSIRVDGSHHDVHQRHNMLANGLEASTGRREALVPPGSGMGVMRRAGPQPGALHQEFKQDGRRAAAPKRWLRPGPHRAKVVLQETGDTTPSTIAAPAAYIEFIIGVPEPCVPDVSLTRARDGSSGVATFTFDNPSFLQASSEALGECTGMYLKDNEGTMQTSEVTATFTNGKPRFVKGVFVMQGGAEWDRFMRFMERYSEANGLGFSKA